MLKIVIFLLLFSVYAPSRFRTDRRYVVFTKALIPDSLFTGRKLVNRTKANLRCNLANTRCVVKYEVAKRKPTEVGALKVFTHEEILAELGKAEWAAP